MRLSKRCPGCGKAMSLARKSAEELNVRVGFWKCVNLNCKNDRMYKITPKVWAKLDALFNREGDLEDARD